MPYANNNGVKIYYEVEGKGPSLVMAHGVTRSMNRWRDIGFTDSLKNDNRLILFDARGHGKSDKPHDPAAYSINMVGDVLSVLDELRVDRALYMGYSMGAGIGFKLAVTHKERFGGFILGGWNPYRPQAPSNAPAMPAPQTATSQNNPEAFIRLRERMLGRTMSPEEKKEALVNDTAAITALLATFREVATLDNEELARISVPCLLYAGESDTMYAGSKEASKHIPQAKFFSLPGLDHVQAGSSPLVIPHVKEFLGQMSKR